ncbi:MAG: BACON domain-containing protein [Ktedonobacteraceae bacterium]
MNRFDDLLPEERVQEHEELITLLEHAYSVPISLSSTEEETVIERVRERLLQRRFEDSPQEEDVHEYQTGTFDSNPHITVFPTRKPQRNRQRFRFIALLAATLVITALLITPLVFMRFSLSSKTAGTNKYPTLILSTNAASPGSRVNVTLNHFSPSTRVVLTHDIQEPIAINGSSSITTDARGNATFSLVVDTTWGPGFHSILAEDAGSRSTASANLQITGEGITHPAHLLIDTSTIDMGTDFIGTNTIRSFTLANSGGGSISWSASSDVPWLLVAPSQGIFSQQEKISVAAQRLGLKPGDYHGSLTISSNVSTAQHIEVNMTVQSLPPNAGPVLAITPALLSFTATNSQQNVNPQTLSISNPGSQPLNWSLEPVQDLTCPWLSANPVSGTIPPGGNMTLTVGVNSQCLLPGVYIGTLTFIANGAIDSSQKANISLVVQPYCGLVTSTGFLAFNVVAGQNTPANQSLSLNETPGCAGTPLSWSVSTTAPWLSITPATGQINANDATLVSAIVNAGRGLPASPKPSYAELTFVFGQSSLTVMVKLMVQAAPPTAPIMSASPLSLNFSNIQGQPDPIGQVITITNKGRSPLSWHVMAQPLSPFSWFAVSSTGGIIPEGQSEQVTVHVNTSQLTPGNYVGQITLIGMDAKGNAAPGNPQTIVVNLVIQPPCTLSPPSSSALSFNAVQGASSDPVPQNVLFTATGSCVWPLSWNISAAPAANWLTQTGSSGSIGGAGQSGSDLIGVNITGLVAGTYTSTLTITANDASGVAAQESTQSFTVTLTILQPCVLSPISPNNLTFRVPQGTTHSPTQMVTLSETGTCNSPITWTASTTGQKPWVVLSATTGTDTGSGSIVGVSIDPTGFPPGSYSYPGIITITATDSTGATILGSGQTITLTVTVTA